MAGNDLAQEDVFKYQTKGLSPKERAKNSPSSGIKLLGNDLWDTR